jgi:hypothetical protein
MKDPDSTEGGADWLTQPVLNISRNTTITLDLNRTESADITVPNGQAKPLQALVSYEHAPVDVLNAVEMPSFSDIRLAHVGPRVASGLVQTWSGQWTKGDSAEYDIVGDGEVKKVVGHRVHHYKASELATVKAGLGASAPGKTGMLGLIATTPLGYGLHTPVKQKLPTTRTLYLSTGEGAEWYFDAQRHTGKLDQDGLPLADAASNLTSIRTTLYRNGTKVGSNTAPPDGGKVLRVPASEAAYRLTTTATRSAKVQAASTRVDAS